MNKDKSIKDLKQYNDKIKTQLEYSKARVWNLERENARLTNELNTCMIERNNFLSRIEKADEYMNNTFNITSVKDMFEIMNKLEDILNVRSDE